MNNTLSYKCTVFVYLIPFAVIVLQTVASSSMALSSAIKKKSPNLNLKKCISSIIYLETKNNCLLNQQTTISKDYSCVEMIYTLFISSFKN